MPRYFFHIPNDVGYDAEGTVLDSVESAKIEAVKLAGEVLKENPEVLMGPCDFRVEVTGEGGEWLFSFLALGLDMTSVPAKRPSALR
uniref:DUF6894 family protein n=1 Tax=uncultured Sphingomonas sp. TaxID=158754 RepID=UPI0035CC226C